MISAADGVAVGATASSDHISVMADRDRSAATIGRYDQAVIGRWRVTRAGNCQSRWESRDDRAGLVIDRDELALAGHVAAEIGRMIGAADDRKVTRPNSSHDKSSNADFCCYTATIGRCDQAVIGRGHVTRAGNCQSRWASRD